MPAVDGEMGQWRDEKAGVSLSLDGELTHQPAAPASVEDIRHSLAGRDCANWRTLPQERQLGTLERATVERGALPCFVRIESVCSVER
jgi:hypothetical protein